MKASRMGAFFRKLKYWWKVKHGARRRSFPAEVEDALSVMASFEGLEQEGMLARDVDSGKVFIASILALPYLHNGVHWRRFVQNVRLWASYSDSRKAWEEVFRNAEQEAVKKLKESGQSYTLDKLWEVRCAARKAVPVDAVTMPEPAPMEFVICTSLTEAERAEVIAVGRWDGYEMDFASFNHVRQALEMSPMDEE